MASVAHQCLVAALDHSNADHIEVILDVGLDGEDRHETPVLKLPPRALRFFAELVGPVKVLRFTAILDANVPHSRFKSSQGLSNNIQTDIFFI